MTSTRTLFIAATAMICSGCATQPDHAAALAPYPENWSRPSTGRPVLGAYAMKRLESDEIKRAVDAVEKRCRSEGRPHKVNGESLLDASVQKYWIYRTSSRTVMYSLNYRLHNDSTNCTSTITPERKIVDVRGSRRWPEPFQRGHLRNTTLPYVSYTKDTVLGVRAKCMSASNGFEGFSLCVSAEQGPSNGLLLTSEYGSDDFSSGGSWTLDAIIPNALIDTALLEADGVWGDIERL